MPARSRPTTAGGRRRSRLRRVDASRRTRGQSVAQRRQPSAPALPLEGGESNRASGRGGAGGEPTLTPQALAAARLEAARKRQGRPLALRDRAHARAARGLDRARASTSAWSRSTPRPPASTRCRRRCAASRSRSRRTRPATSRSRTARAATAATAACSTADSRPTSSRSSDGARGAASRCSRTPASSRSGRTSSSTCRCSRCAASRSRRYDDTMLMSYVLDAGRSGHGLDALAQRYFGHTTIDLNDAHRHRQSRKLTLRPRRRSSKAAEYAAEDADMTLRLWQLLKPRADRRARDHRLRDAGAAAGRRCWRAWSGAASRSTGRCCRGSPASSRSAPPALEAEIQRARRRAAQPRQPQAARRHPVRQDGAARRHQDQDRRSGRPARACSTSWPSRATRCRRRSSTGGRSRS